MLQITQPEYLTVMHAGDRTKEAIDAGGVLPGYAGVIVRDGYAGYDHLADALHAWCGAHNLRDLKDLYTADPDGQLWARSMADLLIDANATATAARSAGRGSLGDADLAHIRCWYRGAVAKGIADNQGNRTQIGKDGLRLARRFRDHEDMILRFATNLAVGFTSNRCVMRSVEDVSPGASADENDHCLIGTCSLTPGWAWKRWQREEGLRPSV